MPKLWWVTGKGGVGKSTCGLGLALALSRKEPSALYCALGRPSPALRALAPDAAHKPIEAAAHPGLWLCTLSESLSLQDYLTEHLKVRPLVKLAVENVVLARLWNAAPSVYEFALLDAIYRLAVADAATDLRHIVVDLPATGHAVAMLGVPRGLLGIMGLGPLAQRAREVDMLIRNAESSVVLVTLPEELPMNETVELSQRLRQKLELATALIIVNRTSGAPLDGADQARLAALRPESAGATQDLVDLVLRAHTSVERESRLVHSSRTFVDARWVQVGAQEVQGRELVLAVGDALSDQL